MSDIEDFSIYSPINLKIIDSSGKFIPFQLNIFQRDMENAWNELRKEGRPVRILDLKARQIGSSTYWAAKAFHYASTQRFKKVYIGADVQDHTDNLFNMINRYYEFSEDHLKPMKRYSNRKELIFANPHEATRDEIPGLMSSVTCFTAGGKSVGRSGTIQFLLGSEFAFWPNAGEVVTGLFQSVPMDRDTAIVLESTANGMSGDGEEFYLRCQEALDGNLDWKLLFHPWYWDPRYRREVEPSFKASEEEKDLMKLYSLDLEQIAWRRYKIKYEMGKSRMDPLDQFRQEYPANPHEAFLASGRPLFNNEFLASEIERLRSKPFKTYEVDPDGSWREDPRGRLRVFEDPREDKYYSIGADVAEGLESGDYSTACVVDREMNQVASWHGHVAPDLFGKILVGIGKRFNNALLAVEVNNHGLTTTTKIKEMSYLNVYTRQVKEERAEMYTKKIGWRTDKKTKPLMLDHFVACFRDNVLNITDTDLLREMMKLTLESDGDVVLNGRDRTVAACIALQGVKQVIGDKLQATYPGSNWRRELESAQTVDERIKALNRKKKFQSSWF